MDVRRKKAGSVLRFEGVRVHNLEPKPTAGKATNRHKERLSQTTGRDPRHRVHGTLNLEELRTKQIHKIHVRLITRFNGQKVIY